VKKTIIEKELNVTIKRLESESENDQCHTFRTKTINRIFFFSFSSFLAGYLDMNITTEKEISQVLSKYTNGKGVLFTDEQI